MKWCNFIIRKYIQTKLEGYASEHLNNLDTCMFIPIVLCDKRGENVDIFSCATTKLLIWLKQANVCSYVLKSYTTLSRFFLSELYNIRENLRIQCPTWHKRPMSTIYAWYLQWSYFLPADTAAMIARTTAARSILTCVQHWRLKIQVL